MTQYTIRSGSWGELQAHAKLIREHVFIQEQQIAVQDEWDEQDAVALHFMVYAQDQPIATARLLQNNSIGRVAVLKAYRGKGIGKLLMEDIIQHAQKEKRAFLKLSAQVYAIPFYAGLGFNVRGDEYLDCGIPHVDMWMQHNK
ncbi:GNAT family N-acetyltransferase [Acinetobacter sp. ANC 4648]|uniref:GNAT family N-acetyltransferase n=1 Tax=Acinetobacter sp. ANC 4648 TaxID=1977875 RepID=UPI000A34B12C|nr:GNAT family N-acetyltransferase [Acinetobacter sp. ANC 4648]OTG80036.1 GNAT family N-acetyltransferase [Acinetobacter sp. ANC 4648]